MLIERSRMIECVVFAFIYFVGLTCDIETRTRNCDKIEWLDVVDRLFKYRAPSAINCEILGLESVSSYTPIVA